MPGLPKIIISGRIIIMKREQIHLLPKSPGIYIFKDKENNIIYVGKAKSIRLRVSSYFKKNNFDLKNQIILEELEGIDHIVTKNEEEALLLEAQIIQEKQPKFNMLLKDGQPYVYFLFTSPDKSADIQTAEIKIVRNKKQKGTYFGPFLKKQEARKIYEYLVRTFKLRICNKKMPSGCLNFHIGLCAGTCIDNFNVEDYNFRLEIVKKILGEDHENLKLQIQNQIIQYNKQLKFEQAKILHEYIFSLDHIIDVIKTRFSESKYQQKVALASSIMPQEQIIPDFIGTKLKKFLELEIEPKTIDCFDISHFQSRHIVGSCVRFTNGIPEKNKFRLFKIKTLEQQDDYAALNEIVQRRYKDQTELPDLIVIDGGKGQLNAVQYLFPETPFVSIAKKEEILFSSKHNNGIRLDIQTEVGRLLIALRDYAHHFAISYHRKKSRKSFTE